METLLLEMKHITKTFPGVRALNDVNLQVRPGEIHAIVGENGAGKSTLMNILSGVYPASTFDGDILVHGKSCQFHSIKESEEQGIVIIHQELALVPYLTIAENMFLGNEQGRIFSIDWDKTYSRADNVATSKFAFVAFGPVAHAQTLWNILGMYVVGFAAVLLGGCPLRQLVLAGQGSADSVVTVLGMFLGAAAAHNFGFASAPAAKATAEAAAVAGGPSPAGQLATVVCIVFLFVVAYTGIRKEA